jgi:hypothetical protein
MEKEIVILDLSASDIKPKKSVLARRMIFEVQEALQTQSPAVVMSNFLEYQKEFPKLFSLLIGRQYSPSLLEILIGQLEAVENGQKSQHDASVVVGSVLVNQFVKPQIQG